MNDVPPAPQEPAPDARRGSWWYPAALAAVVCLASGREQVAVPGWFQVDKLGHFLVFGLLATVIARTQPRSRWWWAILVASVFGVVDEARQSLTPGRSVELADWLSDTAGAALAVTLYVRWDWYRRGLELPVRLPGRTRRLRSLPAPAQSAGR